MGPCDQIHKNWGGQTRCSKLGYKKGKSIYFKGLEIVPRERIDSVLRTKLYDKECEVGFGRDSAFYTLSKSYVGLPRRKIMEFLRKQKTLGETRPSVAQPRRKAGPRLKYLTLETDLCFIRKDDLVRANPRFEKTQDKEETYCLTTVEKSSSLCKLDYVTTKQASVVTPKVIEHIRWFAKRFGKKPSDFELHCDRGTEFRMSDIAKHVKKAKYVNTGVSVEKMNQSFQQNFYRILKNRQSTSVPNAIAKAQKLCNNAYSSIHKKSPNEVVDEKMDSLKTYNATRKTYIKGDNRGELGVGQHVRLLVKKAKQGIDYKSYKNKTYSAEVYVIKKKTKTTTPAKYYVNKRWLTIDSLLKSAPRDQESNQLIEERTKKQTEADKKKEEEEDKKLAAQREAEEKRKAELRKGGKLMRLRSSSRIREKIQKRKEEQKRQDELIEAAEQEYQKKRGPSKKPKRVKYFKQAAEEDEEWTPDSDKPKKKKKRKPRRPRMY